MSVLSEARLLTWYAGKVPCVLVAERARLLSVRRIQSATRAQHASLSMAFPGQGY